MDIEAMLELPAGRELDRVVAEALGWRAEQRHIVLDEDIYSNDYWVSTEAHAGEYDVWVLIAPDGKVYPPNWQEDGCLRTNDNETETFPMSLYDTWEIWYVPRHSTDTPALAIARTWLAYRKADTP